MATLSSVKYRLSARILALFVTSARNDLQTWTLHLQIELLMGYTHLEFRGVGPNNHGATCPFMDRPVRVSIIGTAYVLSTLHTSNVPIIGISWTCNLSSDDQKNSTKNFLVAFGCPFEPFLFVHVFCVVHFRTCLALTSFATPTERPRRTFLPVCFYL